MKKTGRHLDINVHMDEPCEDGKCGMGWMSSTGGGKCGNGGFIYSLGFVGAAIYYLSTAGGFLAGVIGLLKAIIWPVFLVLELFEFIGA